MKEENRKGTKMMRKKTYNKEYTDEAVSIYLRPITLEDTEYIVDWRNSESVRRRFIYQEPFTRQGHEAWMKDMVETGKAVQFIICDKETDRPLGSVYIRNIDKRHNKAEYGIFIGEESARGRGIGTAVARIMLRHCREKERLHRVYLRVFADNLQAIRSYEKAGFQREALLRDDVYVGGNYRDIVLMGAVFDKYR